MELDFGNINVSLIAESNEKKIYRTTNKNQTKEQAGLLSTHKNISFYIKSDGKKYN